MTKRSHVQIFGRMAAALLVVSALAVVSACTKRGGVPERAEQYLQARGIKAGVNKRSDGSMTIVQIGHSSFKYDRGMADDEFFIQRDKAVCMAYADAMAQTSSHLKMDVGTVESRVELADCRPKKNGNADKQLGDFLKEGFEYSTVDKSPCKRHCHRFSAKRSPNHDLEEPSMSTASSAPLFGASAVKLFTWVDNENFCVELVVECDPQFGKMAISAVRDGSRLESCAQKLDVETFVGAVADGLQSFPQTVVDQDGMLWGIGVSVGSRGQRPFGKKLDEMARDSAAFSLGCHVSVETTMRTKGDLTMFEEDMRLDATDLPHSMDYPEHMAMYFHRDGVDAVTGRKCTIAVCALPSGASDASREYVLRCLEDSTKEEMNRGRVSGIKAFFESAEQEGKSDDE